MRVVAASVPIVGAYLVLVFLAFSLLFLLVEGEHDNFNVLLRNGVADQLNTELVIRPVLALKAVKDGTCIAVILLHSLGEHALEKLLRQVLVLFGIDIGLFFLALLLCLLLFLLLSKSILKLDILILEELGSFVAHGVATLLPEVDKLVESDEASLVLLGQEVGCSCPAGALRAEHDHVELLVLLESRRHLYLKLISEHLSKLALQLTLQGSQSVTSLRYLLLGLRRLFELGPIVALLILGVLLTVFLLSCVFEDLLFESIVLLDADLGLLDLTLELLHATLVVILLLDLRPELAAWLAQGQLQRLA